MRRWTSAWSSSSTPVAEAPPPFAVQAAGSQPSLAHLMLALAAEFRLVDRDGALATLDHLAETLAGDLPRQPELQCDACISLLGDLFGLGGDEPQDLMLDAVLDRGAGHPALLAVVYTEVARRAGVPIAPVGAPGLLLVAHLDARRPLLIDPATPGTPLPPGEMPHRLWRQCPHEVAFTVLDELVTIYSLADDLARATRAAELRLALPICRRTLEVVRTETARLRSRLHESASTH